MPSGSGDLLSDPGFDHWANATGQVLDISVGAFFQSGFGITSLWFYDSGGVPTTQTGALGADPRSTEPAEFLLEGRLLYALLLAEGILRKSGTHLDFVVATAGNWRAIRALSKSFRVASSASPGKRHRTSSVFFTDSTRPFTLR